MKTRTAWGRGLLLTFTVCAGLGMARARELTFEDRVRAQEAIERVYYSHQIGATQAFEDAVPRRVLEEKVRTYLKESAALEGVWKAPITADTLEAELNRIAGSTRFPERLEEIYAALGQDVFLLQECFARPVIADRLVRNFLAGDARIHAGPRREAEDLRQRLVTGGQRVEALDLGRSRVVVVRRRDRSDGPPPAPQTKDAVAVAAPQRAPQAPAWIPGMRPDPFELDSPEFELLRREFPVRTGEIGPVVEEPDAFVVRVLLSETEDSLEGEVSEICAVTDYAEIHDWPCHKELPTSPPETIGK